MRTRSVGVSLAALFLTWALTGCGGAEEDPGPSAPTVDVTPSDEATTGPVGEFPRDTPTPGAGGLGLPGDDTTTDENSALGAGWTGTGTDLYVVTYGSSTCPRLAEPEAELDGSTVVVTFRAETDRPCTMDYVPSTSVVGVPDSIDPTSPVTVEFSGIGVVQVPPLGESGAGAFGWFVEE